MEILKTTSYPLIIILGGIALRIYFNDKILSYSIVIGGIIMATCLAYNKYKRDNEGKAFFTYLKKTPSQLFRR